MEEKYQLRKQDLLDRLAELADLLSAGRRSDPNSRAVKMQLEAIQVELETLGRQSGNPSRMHERDGNVA